MLKKLIKYEWKAVWKIPAVINIFLIVVALLGIIVLSSPVWELNSNQFPNIDFYHSIFLMFYMLSMCIGSVAIYVFLATRFYQNMYCNEGYLTHTLPVTPRQLLLAKLFVGSVWVFINLIVVLASMFSLFVFDIKLYSSNTPFLSDFQENLLTNFNIRFPTFCILMLLCAIISTINALLMIYSSISLGQLMTKHKLMGSFLFYFLEYSIIQIISLIGFSVLFFFLKPLLFNTAGEFHPQMISFHLFTPLIYGTLILTIVISFIQYIITEYMIKKKLNLD